MAEPAYAPDLEGLKRKFQNSQSMTDTARQESLIDRDYFDGYQWTPSERRALSDRKQPDTVFNRVRVAVNGIKGVAIQGATDPRAYPRNPDDEDMSDVVSKSLRFIGDKSDFASVKVEAFENYLVEGTCAAIIEVGEDNYIFARQIRWEEYFYDPYARQKDLGDKSYDGIAKWMFADDVAARYPSKKQDIENYFGNGGSGLNISASTLDRPDWGSPSAWVDSRKRRVLTVEMYHKDDGKWWRSVFYGQGILETGPSPYHDEKGLPYDPIVARSVYVDRENKRYGIVRDMRGPQDELNKRRSKLLHLLSVSQIQAVDPSAIEVNADDARKEAARPDGVIPFGWQKVSTTDIAAGQASLLAEAKDEIERLGANPAVLGRQAQDASGRAQMVRQQAGLTELATLFQGLEQWELSVYRQMWDRAKQFWKGPMFVRVTDDVRAPEFIGLNQPIMGPPQVVIGPNGMPTLQPTQAGVKNAVQDMDVDIILDSVPDTANLQQEQFQALIELAKSGVQISPEILIEASSLPNKRELIEKLKSPEQAQAQQAVQQIAQGKAVADIDKTKSETVLNAAKTQQIAADIHIGAFQAGHEIGSTPPPGDQTGASAA